MADQVRDKVASRLRIVGQVRGQQTIDYKVLELTSRLGQLEQFLSGMPIISNDDIALLHNLKHRFGNTGGQDNAVTAV
jgi:hypothetical protein